MNLRRAAIKLLCLIALVSSSAIAQSIDTDLYSTQSPYHTIFSHLRYLQHDMYYSPSVASGTLAGVDSASVDAKQLALRLKDVLDQNGLLVDLDQLPRNKNYIDSVSGKAKYVLFATHPGIFVSQQSDGSWKFSQETVEQVPDMYLNLFPYGTRWIVESLPKNSERFLGLQLWQYVGIVVLLLVAYLTYIVVTWLLKNLFASILRRIKLEDVADTLIKGAAKPVSMLLAFGFAMRLLPVLKLPVEVYVVLDATALIVVGVLSIVVGFRVIDILSDYLEKLASNTPSTLDDQFIPLLRKVLKIVVVVAGVIVVLQSLRIDITALLAGISIGGLALALAAQDTVKNFFGSLMIFVDRPFQIGDWILHDGLEGTVEEIGLRSTRVRSFYNSIVYIPNGQLADATIDNMGMRVYRRFKTTVSVTYDTPPDIIEGYVEALRELVLQHPRTRKDYFEIHLNNMGATSLDILVYIFFEVEDWSQELRARQEVILGMMKIADKMGVRFAFPTQTIHIEDFPEKRSLTPQAAQDPESVNTLGKAEATAYAQHLTQKWPEMPPPSQVPE